MASLRMNKTAVPEKKTQRNELSRLDKIYISQVTGRHKASNLRFNLHRLSCLSLSLSIDLSKRLRRGALARVDMLPQNQHAPRGAGLTFVA